MTMVSLLQKVLILCLALVPLSLADVTISKPLIGQTFDASGGSVDITVSWIESQGAPLLDKMETYTFTLCSGPNTDIDPVSKLAEEVAAKDIEDYSIDLTIRNTIGADGPYYIQVYAVSPTGYTIHYTFRFTLTGMTGTYEPTVGVIANPPDPQTALNDGTTLKIDSKSFTVPYTLQTGDARFAPMQTQPGSKVTRAATDWSRRYATSSVSYFSSVRSDLLKQHTTITPGWSYTISSAANWASPALYPSDNGGWYDPAEKLQTPVIMTAASTLTNAAPSSEATNTSA